MSGGVSTPHEDTASVMLNLLRQLYTNSTTQVGGGHMATTRMLSNEERASITGALLDFVDRLSPDQVIQLGWGLLQLTPTHPQLGGVPLSVLCAIRAYGGSMLSRALAADKITAASIQPDALLTWIEGVTNDEPIFASTPGLIVRSALCTLLVDCAVRIWPEQWSDDSGAGGGGLVQRMCPEAETLISRPVLISLLQHFCDVCVEPLSFRVPASRMGRIRGGLVRAAPTIIAPRVVRAMRLWYTAGDEAHLRVGLQILSRVGSVTSPLQWAEFGFHDVFNAVVSHPPLFCDALFFAASLLSNEQPTSPPPQSQQQQQQQQRQREVENVTGSLLRELLIHASTYLLSSANDLDRSLELLEMIGNIPASLLRREEASVLRFAVEVLQVPSVLFGGIVLDVFKRAVQRVDIAVSAAATAAGASPSTVVESLLRSLLVLCSKHLVHIKFPDSRRTVTLSTDGDHTMVEVVVPVVGVRMSREQFSSAPDTFDAQFADLRGSIANVLQSLSTMYPAECAVFLVQIFDALPRAPFQGDSMTQNRRYVSQQSRMFSEWNAAQFCLEQLATGNVFVGPSGAAAAAQCLSKLLELKLEDAVLIPVQLNMLLPFWAAAARDATHGGGCWPAPLSEQLFRASLDVMFFYMCAQPPAAVDGVGGDAASRAGRHAAQVTKSIYSDADLQAARKRACTAFIHAAIHNGASLVNLPGVDLIQMCQGRLVDATTLSHEKALLYEAICALSNQMGDDTQSVFLERLIGPLRGIVMSVQPESLPSIICAVTPAAVEQRATLRDAIGVLAAVLRRCKASPFMTSFAMTLIPVLGSMVLNVHSMQPESVPPKFAALFEMATVDRDQFLNGAAKKSAIAASSSSSSSSTQRAADVDVDRARSALQQMRLYLYQSLGTIGKFVALESYAASLAQTTAPSAQFAIHTMRAFCENALFPWARQSLPCAVSLVLPAVAAFLESQRLRRDVRGSGGGGAAAEEEVIDAKQLYFFSRDVLTLVTELTEISGWAATPGVESAVVGVLSCLLQCRFEPRGTIHGVMRLVDPPPLPPTTTPSSGCSRAGDRLSPDACGELFGKLGCIVPLLEKEADRDFASQQLAYTFCKDLTRYSAALVQWIGCSTADLDRLVASISLASRADARKRIMLEFLMGVTRRG